MLPAEAAALLHRLADKRHARHHITPELYRAMTSPAIVEWLAPLLAPDPAGAFLCFIRSPTMPHSFLAGWSLRDSFAWFNNAHLWCNEDCSDSPAPAVDPRAALHELHRGPR